MEFTPKFGTMRFELLPSDAKLVQNSEGYLFTAKNNLQSAFSILKQISNIEPSKHEASAGSYVKYDYVLPVKEDKVYFKKRDEDYESIEIWFLQSPPSKVAFEEFIQYFEKISEGTRLFAVANLEFISITDLKEIAKKLK